jgi:hypothetical protein
MIDQWGDITIGDHVTSEGRHGAGQTIIRGTVERIERDLAFVRTADDMVKTRTLSNLRRETARERYWRDSTPENLQ